MSYPQRVAYLAFIDSCIVIFSIYVSDFILTTNQFQFSSALLISSITLLLSHHLFAYRYRLYKRLWQYASIGELVSIGKAVSYSVLITAIVQLIVFQEVYIRILLVTWMMHILLIGGVRFAWRLFRDTYIVQKKTTAPGMKRVLLIGAGAAGTMVARQLKFNRERDLYPVAFIDDDPKKHHLEVLGLPVIGGREKIAEAVRTYQIEHIIIAIPSLRKKELNAIVTECTKTGIKTQTVPLLEDIMTGKVSVHEVRDVQVEDLLGRDPVELDTKSISDYIAGSVVLVTGAGGSIGSEICRQISQFSPKQVILLGHGENSIYSIDMELRNNNPYGIEYIPEIADIQDRDKMFQLMRSYRPKVVFHAAAHKHVPLMERNPEEAVKNNVIGTKNVAEAADAAGVERFVMISSDKAVNPTNVMGATKRLAEMIIQDLSTRSATRFAAVRFGNVLGSRGSVIPLFKKQIEQGGPVTVTDERMQRYFMTIPEASRLVIQAGALAKGGEIFVLDMGEPVKIVDLARNLIRLSGYTEEEIEIVFTGMRPGEKLYEELLNPNEVNDEQVYSKIYVGKTSKLYIREIQHILSAYQEMDHELLRKQLLDIANNRVPAEAALA